MLELSLMSDDSDMMTVEDVDAYYYSDMLIYERPRTQVIHAPIGYVKLQSYIANNAPELQDCVCRKASYT